MNFKYNLLRKKFAFMNFKKDEPNCVEIKKIVVKNDDSEKDVKTDVLEEEENSENEKNEKDKERRKNESNIESP